MERFIRYKRIEKSVAVSDLELLFYELVADGFEIIYYHETNDYPLLNNGESKLRVVIVAGKKQIAL